MHMYVHTNHTSTIIISIHNFRYHMGTKKVYEHTNFFVLQMPSMRVRTCLYKCALPRTPTNLVGWRTQCVGDTVPVRHISLQWRVTLAVGMVTAEHYAMNGVNLTTPSLHIRRFVHLEVVSKTTGETARAAQTHQLHSSGMEGWREGGREAT